MWRARYRMDDQKKLNWPTALFLLISPVVAAAGFAWWIVDGRFNFLTLILAVVFAMATGLGITAGYHRLFAHRSFDAPWPVRLLFLLLGGACFQGSAWEWCTDHRRHHNHIDNERDPYNIKRGFWHAHMLWLFFKRDPEEAALRAADLWSDPLVRLQHRFYLPLSIIGCFVLPMAVAGLWGDALGGLLVAGALRVVLNQHFTFAINSVCHCFGTQTYSTRHSARDNWLTALFTYGEGYHNYHHEFPVDYRNGIRFFHWDPTKWLIRGLSLVGLARNLRVVEIEKILLKRMAAREARLVERLSQQSSAFVDFARSLLESTRSQAQDAATRLRAIRREYHVRYKALKRQERRRLETGVRQLKSQLRQAEREFRSAMALWDSVAVRLNRMMKVQAAAA